jgi:hypothetical protein
VVKSLTKMFPQFLKNSIWSDCASDALGLDVENFEASAESLNAGSRLFEPSSATPEKSVIRQAWRNKSASLFFRIDTLPANAVQRTQ